MTNCWRVLGIAPTTDRDALRRKYRELVKRYHPDVSRSPEQFRYNTIRCAEIDAAYRAAVREASTAPSVAAHSSGNGADPNLVRDWLGFTFAGVLVLVMGAGVAEATINFPFGPFHLLFLSINWFVSLPLESRSRQIVSALLVAPLAVGFGGLLGMSSLALAWATWLALEKTRLARFSIKAGWLVLTAAQFVAVYALGLHWPFEHRATPYYEVLHDTSKLIAWLYVPASAILEWVRQLLRYRSAKIEAAAANMEQPQTISNGAA